MIHVLLYRSLAEMPVDTEGEFMESDVVMDDSDLAWGESGGANSSFITIPSDSILLMVPQVPHLFCLRISSPSPRHIIAPLIHVGATTLVPEFTF